MKHDYQTTLFGHSAYIIIALIWADIQSTSSYFNISSDWANETLTWDFLFQLWWLLQHRTTTCHKTLHTVPLKTHSINAGDPHKTSTNATVSDIDSLWQPKAADIPLSFLSPFTSKGACKNGNQALCSWGKVKFIWRQWPCDLQAQHVACEYGWHDWIKEHFPVLEEERAEVLRCSKANYIWIS